MTLIYILIGSCLASHGVVVFDRLRIEQDFIFPSSHCQTCLARLSILDMIPILSYICLRGRCHYCNDKIPPHLFFFELVGALFGYLLSISSLTFLAQLTITTLFFFLALAAAQDYFEQEFDAIFLLVPLTAGIQGFFSRPLSLPDIELGLPILIVLLIFVLQRKIGLGDLLFYVALGGVFGFLNTNYIFIGACLILINTFVFKDKTSIMESQFAFLPAISISTFFFFINYAIL